MNSKKHFGVVYTPDWTVKMMLNKLPSLEGVAICDPSCGDGQFLVAVVDRVCEAIQNCQSKKARLNYYSTLKNLTGMDIDTSALKKCKTRLDMVVKKYQCDQVEWQLKKVDAIDRDAWKKMVGKFDAVVGNPPYIRIQHLEDHRRQRIGNDWQLMAGCTDMFILFFEMGLELLRSGGSLVFITPNSWMKSKSGVQLRECLRNSHQIQSIIDFGEHQVFEDATTYTAITDIQKDGPRKTVVNGWKCVNFNNKSPKLVKGKIDLTQKSWSVFKQQDLRFINRLQQLPLVLGDVADINVGIQTLADDIFVFNVGTLDIEEEITRGVIKASVMKNGADMENRAVIYPYDSLGKLMPEKHLKSKFPKAYCYLNKNKRRLLARDKGKIDSSKWYGYGREVSIRSGFGEKILTSSMNRAPNFQKCPDPDYLYYSGYAVKPKEGVSVNTLLEELNSKEMYQFVQLVSRPFRGGWFSYAKSVIETFPISEKVYV